MSGIVPKAFAAAMVAALVIVLIRSHECRKVADAGLIAVYGPLQGCMVRVGGKWIPVETIRDVEVKK